MKLKSEMFAHLRDATRQILAKGPGAASAAIQQALQGLNGGGAGAPGGAKPAPAMRDINPPPASAKRATAAGVETEAPPAASADAGAKTAQHAAEHFAQDLLSRLGVPGGLHAHLTPGGTPGGAPSGFQMPHFDLPGMGGMNGMGGAAGPAPALKEGAQFLSGSFHNHAGGRDYKLYIPSSYHGQAMPLVVMLHGCTQNPDDFAAGTQMNAVAEEKQCFVVYPAQTSNANHSKCWNWFNALDQQRGQGEPSIIAGIAQQIIEQYPVDERQVYVAGLSAGGAMAAIVGTLYPELFAAVGVHSGLPFASAKDLPSALAAMRGGAAPSERASGGGIPIIVFHGDRDTTVNPRNGEQLIAQGVRSQASGKAAAASVDSGAVPNGHRYTRTTHSHADGTPLGEHWVIHGAGHAWSGGSAHGSYTDDKGPDASREMMRFFKTVA
ncbi:MAG: PHB depolymerase family esterase [Pseudomonadota bacterium]